MRIEAVMKSLKLLPLLLLVGIAFQQPVLVAQAATSASKPAVTKQVAAPAVKKSVNNLCHAKGTRYYNQTKKFTSYTNLKACLKSGGKMPKK